MNNIGRLYTIFYDLILVVMLGLVVLLLLRLIINYANVNPFTRWVLVVRRWSDPMVEPVRRTLMRYGAGYKFAPLICILIVLIFSYIAIQFFWSLFVTIDQVVRSVKAHNYAAVAGYLLYGLLGLYSALLILRIIVSWGRVTFTNRWFRWLAMITDPLLDPLRRRIPPLGMFDLSPLAAFLIIWILQQVVAATLLRGLPVGW
jgi:YggT family protein